MRSWTFILFLALLTTPLAGQSLLAAPDFDNQWTSAKHIKPGDEITLTLTAEWPRAEAEYAFALPEFKLSNLTQIRQGQSQEVFIHNGTQWSRKTFTLIFSPVQSGPAAIEAFEISYIDPQSQKGGHYTASGQTFTAKSRGFVLNRNAILIIFGLAFFLIALGTGIVLIFRRQKASGGTESGSQVSNPKNPVLEKLGRLQMDSIPSERKETVRILTQCFQEAVRQTTGIQPDQIVGDSFVQTLSAKGLERHQINQLLRLKERLDEARYGAADLNPQSIEFICKEIREVLQKSYSISV